MTQAVLSWGYRETLRNTLKSYKEKGLYDLDDDHIIFFQEITSEDEEIAILNGWYYYGTDKNIGIADAYKWLVENANGETFLFLENDWKLIEPASAAIADGRFLLSSNQADIIRYRHRDKPGEPLWTRQFQGNEQERLTHLLDSVHWTDPSLLYHGVHKQTLYGRPWYITDAGHANWTNNPHMAYTKFLKDNVLPHMGSKDGERDIQSWWERQSFKVAQGTGLFTHERTN